MAPHVQLVKPKKPKNLKKPMKKSPKKEENVQSERPTNGDAESVGGKVPIVEREIKFARLLAGNDPKTRTRVLKNLKRWLNLRSQGSYGEFCIFSNKIRDSNCSLQPSRTPTFCAFGRASGTACGCRTSPWCRRNRLMIWPIWCIALMILLSASNFSALSYRQCVESGSVSISGEWTNL